MEDAHRVFDGRFRGNALYGLDDNLFGLLIGVELGFVYDFVDVAGGVCSGFVFETFDESFFGFFGTQSGEFFQFGAFLRLHFLEFLLFDAEEFLLVVDALLVLFHFLFAPSEFLLTLIEGDFALFEFVFALLNTLVAGLNFFFQFAFLVEKFFFHFQQFFLFEHFGFFVGSV